MKAINLAPEASEKSYEAYLQKCKKNSVESFISEEVFYKVVDGALSISHQTIETRSVSTNFLIIPPDVSPNELIPNDSCCGAEFVMLKNITFSELGFNQLKTYLEIAGGNYSYLVITMSSTNQFIFHGLLFLGASTYEIVNSDFDAWRSWKEDPFSTIIQKCLIITLDDGKIKLSLGNKAFIKIEKGELFEVENFNASIELAIKTSTTFIENARDLTKEIDKATVINFKDEIDSFKITMFKTKKFFHEIITNIANEHHGATLIFGSPWLINDESRFQPGGIPVEFDLGNLILESIYFFDYHWRYCFCRDDDKEQEIKEKIINEKLIAMKKAIINFSKTDGAVIFDKNLNMIGAGVFLKMNSTVEGSGGARRKSAESFVKANPDIMAVVISQDGTVHLFP